MLRILQFGMSPNYGGIESFIMNYYRAMDRTNLQFDFIKSDKTKKIAYEDEILSLGGKVFYKRPVGMRNGYSFFKKSWMEFYERANVAQVHYNTIALTDVLPLKFAKEYGLRTHAHAHPSFYGNALPLWIRMRIVYNRKAVHKYADTCLACSEPAGKWMFGSDFTVIPNSIDCKQFQFNRSARDTVREKYQMEDALVLLNVGRLSVVKNQAFLLDVLKEIKKHRNNIKLVLVGQDGLNGELHLKAKEMKLEENIIFTGMQQRTEQFYSAADLLLFPSLSEGFGIVPVEAQANGLRTIVADTLVDAINVSGTVRYLPITGADAVKTWAQSILENAERLNDKEISQVRKVYDIHNTAEILKAIYTKYE